MSDGEIAFLALCIAAVSVFGLALAYYSSRAR